MGNRAEEWTGGKIKTGEEGSGEVIVRDKDDNRKYELNRYKLRPPRYRKRKLKKKGKPGIQNVEDKNKVVHDRWRQ